MIPNVHPQDAIICCDGIHKAIIKMTCEARDEAIVKWLRDRAKDCDRRANFFNNAASYSVAYECAANAIERGEVR